MFVLTWKKRLKLETMLRKIITILGLCAFYFLFVQLQEVLRGDGSDILQYELLIAKWICLHFYFYKNQ